MPPEAYFPWIDAWLAAHEDALVFVATDEAAYHARIVRRYGAWRARGGARARGGGRVVSAGAGYHSANVIADAAARGGGWAKGGEVRHAARTATRAIPIDLPHRSPANLPPISSPDAQVLLDALLLARCDFLIKSASAVAEFAIWVRVACPPPPRRRRHRRPSPPPPPPPPPPRARPSRTALARPRPPSPELA